MYWIDPGAAEVVVLNSQVVPISLVVVKTSFTVYKLENINKVVAIHNKAYFRLRRLADTKHQG